jgi:MFS family permease
LLTLVLYAGLSGSLFLLPFNLVQVQGYSVTGAGASLLPFVLMMFSLSRWSGGLVDRFGPKRPLVIGPLVVAAANVLYALPDVGGSYWTTFFPAVALQGFGMAITVAPLTTVILASAGTAHAGVASAINNAVARTGGLLAVAIIGILALLAFNRALDARLPGLDLPPGAVEYVDTQRTRLAAAEIPDGLSVEAARQLRQAINESFVASFRLVALSSGVLALAGSLSALVLVEDRRGS